MNNSVDNKKAQAKQFAMPSKSLIPLYSLALVAAICWPALPTSCQNSNTFLQTNNPVDQLESRAETNLLHNNNNNNNKNVVFDQLVNILQSMQNNQNANNANNQRRSPLPLGTMGNNQRAPLAQPISSTPVNPFIAAAQFQPTRRQQNFPQQTNNQNSSPAPPPALTLNRIPNQFVTTTTNNNNNNNVLQNRFNNQQPQPINTIPLGSFGSPPNLRNVPPRGPQLPRLRPQVQFPASGQQPSLRSPLMPPPQMTQPQPQPQPQQQQPRPLITGFAPSGPPPSSANSNINNDAISVVQSPPNAIGLPETTSKLPAIEFSTAETTRQSPASTSNTPASAGTSSMTSEPALTMISASESAPTVSSSTAPSTTTSISSAPTTTTTTSTTESAPGSWNPVNNRTRAPSSTLAPSPDIVTVPPGYNPDAPPAPQNYDISVSAQMGPSAVVNSSSAVQEISATPTASPTETTTIIWSSSSSSSVETTSSTGRIQPTRTQSITTTTSTSISTPPATTTTTTTSTSQAPPSSSSSSPPPSRIRDNSMVMQNDEPTSEPPDAGVVYGKGVKPTRPPPSGQPFIQTAQLDTQVRPYSAGTTSKSNHGGQLPFKPSKQLGNQSAAGGGGGGGGLSVGSGFTIVASGNQSMPVGDIQDYVANAPPPVVSASSASASASGPLEPTISAQGGPDPASFELPVPGSTTTSTPAAPAQRVRRPTFKPKPVVPPIRIDSCIVGDDSSCDQSHNERCVTEYGISSCHCKPGFARLSQLRGYCSPISLVQFNMKIDKLTDDRRLVFNSSLENPNSEEYQYLEFETIQALASAIQQTPGLAKQFMGVRVNKFYERKQKVWANVSLSLEANNVTKVELRVQQAVGKELAKLFERRQPLGDSTLVVADGSAPRELISKLVDVNECASKELNDCSKHATCSNEFGGFSCQCLAGFEDKYLQQLNQDSPTSSSSSISSAADRSKVGRLCMGCSPAYCSNRGECSVVEGKKQCKCRPNFMGARCDIDSEVLFVAIGGSLVGLIILVVTFWCLFVFNKRWRREQQKMDAMSATSGLTYNYINNNNGGGSSSNGSSAASFLSPAPALTSRGGGGGVGRSSAAAAAYAVMGQRVMARAGGHADQQAIIGSTSSGSSAASQPIACNPYATGYQYEDAGLLIAPASTGSSEQTSPSGNSYRGGHSSHSNHSAAFLAATAAGNAYTLSGHHHHHHHHAALQQAAAHALHHKHHHQHQMAAAAAAAAAAAGQFHPATMADYTRTLNASANYHHHQQQQQQQQQLQLQQQQQLMANGYDTRWRTLQDNSKQQSLAGYYLAR